MLKLDPILAPLNRVDLHADHLHVILIQHACGRQLGTEIQARLPSQIRKQRVRTFLFNDLRQPIHIQRLNIGDICRLRICHDCSRIGINENYLIAKLP